LSRAKFEVRESQRQLDLPRRATRDGHGDLVEAVDQLAHVASFIPIHKRVNCIFHVPHPPVPSQHHHKPLKKPNKPKKSSIPTK
jgi:hypothetical protein